MGKKSHGDLRLSEVFSDPAQRRTLISGSKHLEEAIISLIRVFETCEEDNDLTLQELAHVMNLFEVALSALDQTVLLQLREVHQKGRCRFCEIPDKPRNRVRWDKLF